MKIDEKQVFEYLKPTADIRYANLRTSYSFTRIKNTDEEIDLHNMSYLFSRDSFQFVKACFRNFFENFEGRSNDRYVIAIKVEHYFKRNDYTITNHCFLRIDQLYDHVDYLRKTLGLDFNFLVRDTGEYYTVLIDTKKLNGTEKKFVCTWTRYAYEYPTTLAMYDAYRMKEMDRWKDFSLYNLFLLTARYLEIPSLYGDQCISTYGRMVNDDFKFLKEKLDQDVWVLNDIYVNAIPKGNTKEPRFRWCETGSDSKTELYSRYKGNILQYWFEEGNLMERIETVYPVLFEAIEPC